MKMLRKSQVGDECSSTSKNDNQPPVNKLYSSNNNRKRVVTQASMSLTEDHGNSHANFNLPEISAVICVSSTG